MTSKKILVLVLSAAFIAVGALVVGAEEEAKAEKPAFTYVGVKTCKMCHKKPATGDQYTVWSEKAHAGAYATLASEESMAKAKELGIEDPQKSEKCLKCHATAFAVMDQLGEGSKLKITMEEGVSCESCHGAGSGYKSKKVKTQIVAGEIEGPSVGLLAITAETCTECHNEENPFHKEFKYDEYVAKIAHPIPAAEE